MNTAQRGPSNDNPSSIETVVRANESINLNTGLDPVVSIDGWTSRTRAEVDGLNGIVRGYAGLTHGVIDANAEYPIAFASGSVGGVGVVSTSATGRVPVIVSFSFDGRPQLGTGAPSFSLLATLVAGVPSSTASLTSQISFSSFGDTNPVVLTRATRSQAGLAGPVDDAAATPTVSRDGPDIWGGTVQVQLEVANGDPISMMATLYGMVAGSYDGEGYQPTTAAMDFLNSGHLKVSVPAGVSISGASPLWSQAVVVVPEPSTWALWLGGIAALTAMYRRKRQR